MATRKKKLVFSGPASEPFWDAVNSIGNEKKNCLLYSYGCRAQELENEIRDLKEQLRRIGWIAKKEH